MNINVDSTENVFSSCKINWNIKNLCFLDPLNDYTFYSPEFILQGVKTMQWRMSLDLNNDKSCNDGQVSFYLEKLPNSTAKTVFVNWELTLIVGSKEFGPYENTVEFRHQFRHGQIDIASTSEIFNSLAPIKPDTLHVRFHFVSYDKDLFITPEEQIEDGDGLGYLSNDLDRLKRDRIYTDIKINVNDQYIEAHKAILSLNDKFASYIKEARNDVIEISNFNYGILDDFINYLYSEKIKYLRNRASVSMLRCLEHFNCDDLKTHYVPETIEMESEIKVKTHEFYWYIPDIMDKNEFVITSPPTKGMDTTWKLTLSLKRNKNPNKNLSLYAEITDGEKPSQFCLEFCLLNESNKELFSRRLIRINGCCDNMGFDNFVTKQSISDHPSLTIRGALCIFFRVKTSTGQEKTFRGCHSVSFISPIREEKYLKLSEKMEDLLQNKTYLDIVCYHRYGISMKAHKCILAARSPVLKSRIDENENANRKGFIFLGDLKDDLLEPTINYIYSGNLNDTMKAKIADFYYLSAADMFHIESLRKHSLKYMRSVGMYVK